MPRQNGVETGNSELPDRCAEDLIRICLGPRCSDRGSELLAERVLTELRQRGLDGAVRVRTVRGICHGRCGLGPNLFVGQRDDWYAGVMLDDIPGIVDQHIIGGRPVERLLGKLPDSLQLDDKLPWD